MNIRWGILGAGHIAEKWAADLPLAGNASLRSVWCRDPRKGAEFAQRHQASRVDSSLEAFLESEDLDAIYVATPHSLHAEGAAACLRAGKPVLVEKPFGLDRVEVESVVSLARQRKLLCMEALWTRFLPSFRTMLDLIESGRIGTVRQVVADFGFVASSDPSSRLWDPALGGGSLLDIGIYPLFVARAVLGNPDRIQASMTRAETGVDSSCRVGLGWFEGTTASLTSSLVESTPCIAVIEGESGRIVMERMFHTPTTLVVTDGHGVERIPCAPGGHGYEHEIRHFGECLEQGLTESPLWSLEDTLDLSLLLDRVREAATP